MPGCDKCAFILLAGGAGSRFGAGRNKLLCALNEQTSVFGRSLLTFAPLFSRERFIVVTPPELINVFKEDANKIGLAEAVSWISGGTTRDQSAAAGLAALPDEVEFVAIHDAARPLATPQIFNQCLAALDDADGVIPAKLLTDTIKLAGSDHLIQKTLDRSELFAAETPQLFRRKSLMTARKQIPPGGFTDDAAILENAGMRVKIILNPTPNPKLTHFEDLEYLQWLLNSKNSGQSI